MSRTSTRGSSHEGRGLRGEVHAQGALAGDRARRVGPLPAGQRLLDAGGRGAGAPRRVADDDDLLDRRRQIGEREAEALDLGLALALARLGDDLPAVLGGEDRRDLGMPVEPRPDRLVVPRQSSRWRPLRIGIALVIGQPVWVSEMPCQPRLSATTSSAARQWAAWLSPTSATVLIASSRRGPEEARVELLGPPGGLAGRVLPGLRLLGRRDDDAPEQPVEARPLGVARGGAEAALLRGVGRGERGLARGDPRLLAGGRRDGGRDRERDRDGDEEGGRGGQAGSAEAVHPGEECKTASGAGGRLERWSM